MKQWRMAVAAALYRRLEKAQEVHRVHLDRNTGRRWIRIGDQK
jgi:hypothetical protein